ncbi:unnamed protein product [Caretta caretta]
MAELDFRRARNNAVNITLDSDCKHPKLSLKDKNRVISTTEKKACRDLIVVANEGFSEKKQYWEVEVGDKPEWELGVLTQNERGKLKNEKMEKPPEKEYWSLRLSEDGFTVTVHVDPAIALVGQGVMLSCQPGGHNPTNVQVHWYKWERGKNMTLYFYNSTENGTELGRVEVQHRSDAPRGRYENGIVTVKLFPVQVEDSGQYVCAVTNDGVYQEAIALVIVAGFGSAPRLTIDHQQNNSVTLRCTSQGWYPQPEVCWTDSTGQNITAMAETRIQKDGTDLYQIHSTLRVADTASDTISCTIRNPLLKRHRKKVIAISGFFDVEAEYDIITTVTGENAILPCRLITKHLPPSMELQWRKVGPGKDKIIYFYLYDESSPLVNSYSQSDKCPMSYLSPNGDNSREWLRKEYEKKAEVFKGKEFGKGNISLKLNNIQVEDEGKYVCSASANFFHREIIIEVLVIGVGNETSLQVHLQKVCKYECKWKGWYPKPIVFWRNHKGQSINSLAETTEVQDEQNLFTVASAIAVSCDTPKVTCDIVNTESEMIQQSTAQDFDELQRQRVRNEHVPDLNDMDQIEYISPAKSPTTGRDFLSEEEESTEVQKSDPESGEMTSPDENVGDKSVLSPSEDVVASHELVDHMEKTLDIP